MATTPYIPALPYTGDQIILTSGRVTLHAQDDSVMLFGKKSIALSSLGTVNLDVSTKVIINSPKIELGLSAEKLGEPVLLGNKSIFLIARLLDSLTELADALSKMSETQLQIAIPAIVEKSNKVKGDLPKLRADLTSLLSQVTYTK